MKSVSKHRRTHHRSKKAEGTHNYYHQMLHTRGDEDHPIDLVVARRLRDGLARKKLARLEREVMGRTNADKESVLELEALRNAITVDRDEAFFNVGYEHGLADALARARRGSISLSKEVKQFATETRERMVQLEAPWQAALGLLECLWALAAKHQSASR